MPSHPCHCGSGEQREPIYDGHGIYLTSACNRCRLEKLKGFRTDIMERYDCDEPIEPDDDGPYQDGDLYSEGYADDLSNW